MPRLLAFESIGRTASACVVDDAGAIVALEDLAGRPSEVGLVPLLDRLLRTHGRPQALAVAVGPGSFTGLRVGVMAARTLAWLEDLPVHPVDALTALACERGDGLWWPLVPLKRDTTFHAVVRVEAGVATVLVPTAAQLDAVSPSLPAELSGLVAIGPGVTAKPELVQRWRPGTTVGSAAGLTARGVALAASPVPAESWDRVMPAYHQEAAPVLQQRERAQAQGPGTPPPAVHP